MKSKLHNKRKVMMMNKACKLTAIQIVSNDCVEDNFEQINRQLEQLPKLENDCHHLVLLPENALCFADRKAYLEMAEVLGNGPIQSRLAKLAQKYHCTLVCGSFPLQSEHKEKIYTTSLVYSPEGELLEHYNKIHLFDANVADSHGAYKESDTFIAGNEVKVVDCGFIKIGLAICYDVRFPGLFQKLRELGAEVILLPAAFTQVTGEAHWQALLQARAIETQCYVLAANQGGEHFVGREDYQTRSTYGHSMIINPWGTVLEQANIGCHAIQAYFDRETLENVRASMLVQQHNRFSSIQKLN